MPTGGIVGGFFNLTYVSDCSSPKTVLNWLDAATGSGMHPLPRFPFRTFAFSPLSFSIASVFFLLSEEL